METITDERAGEGQREQRSFALALRSLGEDGMIEGYGSVFGVRDSYGDVIEPGAFKASLAGHKSAGTMPAMLWQHDPSEPIGVWTDMSEDKGGLLVKGKLADTQRGRDARTLMKLNAINGLSIGFVATGKSWKEEDGISTRILTGIDLWEVSLVTFPANPAARVTSIKSADVAQIKTIRDAERALRDAGFSAEAARLFVSRVKSVADRERDARQAAAEINRSLERLVSSISKD
jgi:uncharacterized protein